MTLIIRYIYSRYSLNTIVHYPHDKKVVDLKFRPHGDDLDIVHSAVTSSEDGKFKTWTLVDDSDIYSEDNKKSWTGWGRVEGG